MYTLGNSVITSINGETILENRQGLLNVQKSQFTGTPHGNSLLLNNRNATCKVEGCTFTGNTVVGGNCVMNDGQCTLKEVIFHDNTAANGGGLFNQGDMRLFGCEFTYNTAKSNGNLNMGYGGAIYNKLGQLLATGCTFTENRAETGGVLANNAGNVTLHFNRITSNYARVYNGLDSSNLIDATLNWWGSNTGPDGQNQRVVQDKSWLLLTIKTESGEVAPDASTQVTADLYTDNNGVIHQNQSSEYPACVSVSLNSNAGDLPHDLILKYGCGTAVFKATGNMPAAAHLTAVDNIATGMGASCDVNVHPITSSSSNKARDLSESGFGGMNPFKNHHTSYGGGGLGSSLGKGLGLGSSLFGNKTGNNTDPFNFLNNSKEWDDYNPLPDDEEDGDGFNCLWVIPVIIVLGGAGLLYYRRYKK